MTTLTTRTNVFSRLKASFKGILTGLLLFLIAFPLLFINEGRAVKTAKALKEGAAGVVSIDASNPGAAAEGALIHISAEATTEAFVEDPVFGARARALRMLRTVEMYQWKERADTERKEKLGGSVETTTTYTYEKIWTNNHQDHTNFQDPAGHKNPERMPYNEEAFRAEPITVGAFTLSDDFSGRVGTREPLPAEATWLEALPGDLQQRARIHEGKLYIGNPSSPEVGDLRISFEVAYPAPVSLIGRKSGTSLEAYTTSNGRTLALVEQGQVSAAEMFEAAEAGNRTLTWILRLIGFLMMFAGIAMILAPMSVIASIVPFVGRIVGAGTRLVALMIASALSLLTIAVGWIIYRPLLGILLLLIAGALTSFLVMRLRKTPPTQDHPLPERMSA